MPGDLVSVAEAAARLGVGASRIHERIRDGSLPAAKVGNQWAVHLDDLRRVMHHSGPGRPLSAKSAWDLLAVALNEDAAAELSPSARSRARSRLHNLLVQISAARIWEASGLIAHALQNRAERATFSASSLDLEDVRRDERVQLSGVSLPGSGISAGDLVESYVFSRDLDALERDCLLSPASRSRANVILHVVRSEVRHPATNALADVVGSPLALAADLAEHDGVRERYRAIRCLEDLHAVFVPHPHATGAAHG